MVQIVLIGIGAGAAAALLFASIASGSIVATLLFYLAPLPILIAALGWSHWAALVAALSAATALAAVLGAYFFAAFLIAVGMPAWWLGYLALLARPAADPASVEWYPVGRLVFWTALIGTMIVAVVIPTLGTDKDSLQAGLRGAFERAIRLQGAAGGPSVADRPETQRLIDILAQAIPPAAAVLATLLNVVNLWLAGRVVTVSGRLRRPWPDLSQLALPTYAPGLLAVAVAGSLLPDLAGVLSGVLAAALLMAFAIAGFAVLHAVTRGMANRGVALAGAYAAVMVFGWPILGMSLLGLADTAFNIRARAAGKLGPPTLRT
jgi:Predicted membrane protein (DUF2232)